MSRPQPKVTSMCGPCQRDEHKACQGCTHCGCLKSAQYRAFVVKTNPPDKT